jgi:hypothetical protein
MLVAGLSAVDIGDGYYTPFCVQCHTYSTHVTGSDGSRFSAHNNSNHLVADWSGGYGGCLACHYGAKDPMTDIHGGNDAFGFMNGSAVANWVPGTCTAAPRGGDSPCRGHVKGY